MNPDSGGFNGSPSEPSARCFTLLSDFVQSFHFVHPLLSKFSISPRSLLDVGECHRSPICERPLWPLIIGRLQRSGLTFFLAPSGKPQSWPGANAAESDSAQQTYSSKVVW